MDRGQRPHYFVLVSFVLCVFAGRNDTVRNAGDGDADAISIAAGNTVAATALGHFG